MASLMGSSSRRYTHPRRRPRNRPTSARPRAGPRTRTAVPSIRTTITTTIIIINISTRLPRPTADLPASPREAAIFTVPYRNPRSSWCRPRHPAIPPPIRVLTSSSTRARRLSRRRELPFLSLALPLRRSLLYDRAIAEEDGSRWIRAKSPYLRILTRRPLVPFSLQG